jgi:hypothetical protein
MRAVAVLSVAIMTVTASADELQLRLTTHQFDPLIGEPAIPVELRAAEPPAGRPGYYLVQLTEPVTDSHKRELGREAASLLGYVPDCAFIARMTPESASAVRNLDFVRWVGLYHPAYKLSPLIGAHELRHPDRLRDPWLHLVIRVHDTEDTRIVADAVASLGGEVLDLVIVGNKRVLARIPEELLHEIARMDAVLYVFERGEHVVRNNTTRWVVQTNQTANTSIWSHGIHGEGQLVGEMDSGVDWQSCFFRDPQGDPIGSNHRKIQHYSTWGSGSAYDKCTDGHGSHVAGTVLGNDCTGAYAQYNGIAYNARLIMQDIGQDSFWDCLFGFIYPPSSLTSAFQDAYNRGARIHTNSWGGSSNEYEVYAEDIDDFMWDNPSFLVCFAMGNGGSGAGTIGYPATAKNCVSVGATQQATTQNNMASFSSRGPTYDGRCKPTVCAPGDGQSGGPPDIWSADNNANSSPTCNICGDGWNGTSMSTPAVAGCATLIRQYYADGFWPTGIANTPDGFEPSGALVKATLVAAGERMTGGGVSGYPDNNQGWGRVLLEKALYFAGDNLGLEIVDHGAGISTGNIYTTQVPLESSQPARFVLVWTDPSKSPPANPALVNNLNLRVTDPGGTSYWGNYFSGGQSAPGGGSDTKNVVEVVHRNNPAAGLWSVEVIGQNVPQGPQPFALVITGKPSSPMILTGSLTGGQLVLNWTSRPDATAYWVYGADNSAYFQPGLASPYMHRLAVLSSLVTSWSCANGVGDPDHNWTYLVVAVDGAGQELGRTNYFGEHDFHTDAP